MLKKIILILCLFFIECNNSKNEIFQFIHQFGKDDFSRFTNTTTFVRGRNKEGKLVIYHERNLDGQFCFCSIIVTDNMNMEISLNRNYEHFCKTDTSEILNYIQQFMLYDIKHLSVDENNTVMVNINDFEFPNLFRFEKDTILNLTVKNYENIQDNWYHFR